MSDPHNHQSQSPVLSDRGRWEDYTPFRDIYRGITLEAEDLLLLESFQVAYLPGYTPERELAAVLHAYPAIRNFMVKKCPSVTGYVRRITRQYEPTGDEKELAKCADRLVWAVADLIIFNKCPEAYDQLAFHGWDFREVTIITPLEGKVVIDGGAGTGRVALEGARTARQVYAVEPVARLRQFIRDKAKEAYLDNVYVTDGFLHAIPLPDSFADVLITSHALGWQLDKELREFERVVKKGGFIIHCPGTAEAPGEQAQHYRLISANWGYESSRYEETDGWKRKYWKQV